MAEEDKRAWTILDRAGRDGAIISFVISRAWYMTMIMPEIVSFIAERVILLSCFNISIRVNDNIDFLRRHGFWRVFSLDGYQVRADFEYQVR